MNIFIHTHFHYVLSMGAIFGLFAGFYYWYPIITTYNYNEIWAITHFYLMFIGVNVTFGPMHFLGLSGMPRRILDFPDPYLFYNQIASLGSFISFISIIPFILSMFNSTKYILPSITYTYLDETVQINRYNHLHTFNTVPITNS